MITRIEIDGFKAFADFSLDLPPFLAVIGTNASGKSNLAEALTFLATTATTGTDAAVAAIRGDALGLFRNRGDGSQCSTMRFAVELLLSGPFPIPPHFGTRWRYELEIEWRRPEGRLAGLAVSSQRLVPVRASDDAWATRFVGDPLWADAYLRASDYNKITFEAADPSRLALSSPSGDPRLLADSDLRGMMGGVLDELRQVRSLQLESQALREPSRIGESAQLGTDGRHLPNYLAAIAQRTASVDRPYGVLADVETELIGLVREVNGLEVVTDERRRDVRLEFPSRYARPVGAEFASDGTLRMLAMLAALHDPFGRGLVAIEEPENGVFPDRLRHLLGLIQELVSDPGSEHHHDPDRPGLPRPLNQALVTSHSPVVLDAVPRDRIVFLDTTTLLEGGAASHVTRARWLREPDGPARVEGERWPRVTESELSRVRAGLEEPV